MEQLSDHKELNDTSADAESSYHSPYFEQAMKKSGELGPGTTNYPYTVEATLSGHKVEINGMHHINNPEDQSLVRLEQRFADFMRSANNPIVFVEGGMRDVVEMSRDEVIAKFGEPGLVTKLGQDANIPVESPEPPFEQEVDELLKIFPPEEIMQYYFSRALYQWYRNKNNDPNIGTSEQYVTPRMAEWKKIPGLEEADIDYAKLCDKFLAKYNFLPQDMPDDLAERKLHDEASPFNPVSAASSDIRDRFIFARIGEAATQGHDVFLAFGSHHAFVYEQMLRETG